MRPKDEIQAKLNSIKNIDDFTANIQKCYLQIGLDQGEEYIKTLILKYSTRILKEEYELKEDKIILEILNWIDNE